jgi:hypothetical protein
MPHDPEGRRHCSRDHYPSVAEAKVLLRCVGHSTKPDAPSCAGQKPCFSASLSRLGAPPLAIP